MLCSWRHSRISLYFLSGSQMGSQTLMEMLVQNLVWGWTVSPMSVRESRVKYCAACAKSKDRFSWTHSRSIRSMRSNTLLSIFASSVGTSFAVYYDSISVTVSHLRTWGTYSRHQFCPELSMPFFVLLRKDIVDTWIKSHSFVPVASSEGRPWCSHCTVNFWICVLSVKQRVNRVELWDLTDHLS